ncbi:hypothetical protein OG304_23055 [Streptomyces sp. NBC_00160]|uniref:hypothetical protein n=1 Tax=Streptomyces TaxID=1883 RepID=UPI00224DA671|nr:hypothetical protein [Streptomyces sp. NBC_00160]MCX5306297.1 hypothetical protein [Streptomyces sp. NBC_00160]
MTDVTELADRLHAAGLIFRGMADLDCPLIPPKLATGAAGYPPPSGRWPVSSVEIDAQDWVVRANKGWFELSRDGGLFSADREFFVAVERQEEEWWWARVGLAETWDVMGAGAAGLLGSGYGVPGFTMLSLAGDVIVCGMEWQTTIGAVLVSHFDEHRKLREYSEWTAGWQGTPEQERVAIRNWLSILK